MVTVAVSTFRAPATLPKGKATLRKLSVFPAALRQDIRCFATKYLDYAELTSQLQAWAKKHPGIVRLSSIGKSAGGRDIPMLTIGANPDEIRPAIWIDGNMHASELCGSSVALALAEDIIAIHQGKDEAGGKALPRHMADAIRGALVYVVPRISPDGAEEVMKKGRYVRSSPVNDRANKDHAWWEAGDIDGDGEMMYMRQQSPDGELVELRGDDGKPLDPPVMVPRLPEDDGPVLQALSRGAHRQLRRPPHPRSRTSSATTSTTSTATSPTSGRRNRNRPARAITRAARPRRAR